MDRCPLGQKAQNSPHLTHREVEILTLFLEGLFSQEVAERLGVSTSIVEDRLTTLYQKLGVRNRLEAIIRAARLDLKSAA